MARRCSISKRGRQSGHNVSHAKNRTKRVFLPNIQHKKIFVPSLKRSVRLKVSVEMLRTIDRMGIDAALKRYNVDVKELVA